MKNQTKTDSRPLGSLSRNSAAETSQVSLPLDAVILAASGERKTTIGTALFAAVHEHLKEVA